MTLEDLIIVGWPVPGLIVLLLMGWSIHRKDVGKPGLGALLRRVFFGALGWVCDVPRMKAACVDCARGASADLAGMLKALRREP